MPKCVWSLNCHGDRCIKQHGLRTVCWHLRRCWSVWLIWRDWRGSLGGLKTLCRSAFGDSLDIVCFSFWRVWNSDIFKLVKDSLGHFKDCFNSLVQFWCSLDIAGDSWKSLCNNLRDFWHLWANLYKDGDGLGQSMTIWGKLEEGSSHFVTVWDTVGQCGTVWADLWQFRGASGQFWNRSGQLGWGVNVLPIRQLCLGLQHRGTSAFLLYSGLWFEDGGDTALLWLPAIWLWALRYFNPPSMYTILCTHMEHTQT